MSILQYALSDSLGVVGHQLNTREGMHGNEEMLIMVSHESLAVGVVFPDEQCPNSVTSPPSSPRFVVTSAETEPNK